MQIEVQRFLRLIEMQHSLLFVDIESTGLKGDYNSALVTALKPYGKPATVLNVKKPGYDKALVMETKAIMEGADCWVTYYGKGFDLPFLNTRLLKWGLDPIIPKPHIDLYYSLKYRLLTGRKSQGHLLAWLNTPENKMTVGADVWTMASGGNTDSIMTLRTRCESDVKGLEHLYRRTSHLIRDITR